MRVRGHSPTSLLQAARAARAAGSWSLSYTAELQECSLLSSGELGAGSSPGMAVGRGCRAGCATDWGAPLGTGPSPAPGLPPPFTSGSLPCAPRHRSPGSPRPSPALRGHGWDGTASTGPWGCPGPRGGCVPWEQGERSIGTEKEPEPTLSFNEPRSAQSKYFYKSGISLPICISDVC